MKRIGLVSLLIVALSGCQTAPDQKTQAVSVPAMECRFAYGQADTVSIMRKSINVLEEEGFTLRSTDSALGVISAWRERPLNKQDDRIDERGFFSGLSVFGGIGSGGSSRFGLGVGTQLGGDRRANALQIEDVSLVVDDMAVQITRDVRIIDSQGRLRDAYNASNTAFCEPLQQALMP